jgi:hypothetical protein
MHKQEPTYYLLTYVLTHIPAYLLIHDARVNPRPRQHRLALVVLVYKSISYLTKPGASSER